MRKWNQVLTICVLGFSGLILSGCDTPTLTEISTVPVERPQLTVPQVDPVSLREVRWVVLTEENYQDVIAQFTAVGKPFVLFALTEDGYKNLAMNLTDLKGMIEQQQVIITAYDEYYGNEA